MNLTTIQKLTKLTKALYSKGLKQEATTIGQILKNATGFHDGLQPEYDGVYRQAWADLYKEKFEAKSVINPKPKIIKFPRKSKTDPEKWEKENMYKFKTQKTDYDKLLCSDE